MYDKTHITAFPASMTKVLTAILLMEHTKPEDQFTFSQLALDQEKSNYQIEFQPGETINRNTALMILMVLSANDVPYAIAERIGGSVENFANMMNERAKQLGATDSHFVTPNGLHDPNHYTTPYDMAMITRVCKSILNFTSDEYERTTVTTSRQTVSILINLLILKIHLVLVVRQVKSRLVKMPYNVLPFLLIKLMYFLEE